MRMFLSIVWLYTVFVSAVGMSMRLNVSMFPLNFNEIVQVQVMQVRGVTHRLHRRVESNMVSTMQRSDFLTHVVSHELHFRDAETKVSSMGALSIILVHFDKDAGRVIG